MLQIFGAISRCHAFDTDLPATLCHCVPESRLQIGAENIKGLQSRIHYNSHSTRCLVKSSTASSLHRITPRKWVLVIWFIKIIPLPDGIRFRLIRL